MTPHRQEIPLLSAAWLASVGMPGGSSERLSDALSDALNAIPDPDPTLEALLTGVGTYLVSWDRDALNAVVMRYCSERRSWAERPRPQQAPPAPPPSLPFPDPAPPDHDPSWMGRRDLMGDEARENA